MLTKNHSARSSRTRSGEVRNFILENVSHHPGDIARLAAARFGLSRQAIARHLNRLVGDGELIAEGKTKGRTYRRGGRWQTALKIDSTLAEHKVWEQDVAPFLRDVRPNLMEICQYGFTEIFNNVIDHSEGSRSYIMVERSQELIALLVTDNGIGIFRKIRTAYGLEDDREAILELAKGKLTTDAEKHTGEGIFFTSRMFDCFSIVSGELAFIRRRHTDDWLIDQRKEKSPLRGTSVSMQLDPSSEHTTKEVFDRYATEQDDFAFSRTQVAVALAGAGENLVSRSQAKRILSRLERFREIVLDFKGIESIGPAFADEIFRVFAGQHSSTVLLAIHTNADVERMIHRARSSLEGA